MAFSAWSLINVQIASVRLPWIRTHIISTNSIVINSKTLLLNNCWTPPRLKLRCKEDFTSLSQFNFSLGYTSWVDQVRYCTSKFFRPLYGCLSILGIIPHFLKRRSDASGQNNRDAFFYSCAGVEVAWVNSCVVTAASLSAVTKKQLSQHLLNRQCCYLFSQQLY